MAAGTIAALPRPSRTSVAGFFVSTLRTLPSGAPSLYLASALAASELIAMPIVFYDRHA
jgi:hypothetical protein